MARNVSHSGIHGFSRGRMSKVEYVDISTIKPYKGNAKTHPKDKKAVKIA